MASSGACHCLPRGLRRKSPATAVISRGRSVVSSPLDRRGPGDPAITPPPLTCSTPAAVLPRRESRPDLVQISTNEHDSTSGPEGDSTFGLDNVSTSGRPTDDDSTYRTKCSTSFGAVEDDSTFAVDNDSTSGVDDNGTLGADNFNTSGVDDGSTLGAGDDSTSGTNDSITFGIDDCRPSTSGPDNNSISDAATVLPVSSAGSRSRLPARRRFRSSLLLRPCFYRSTSTTLLSGRVDRLNR